MRKTIAALLALFLWGTSTGLAAVPPTSYPVVLVHGLGGYDNLLGNPYWGDDFGTFIGDPCDQFLETSCNANIDSRQRTFVAQLIPLESSEVRGALLADEVENYLATTGARKVNLVGHSQGGLDIRKAAKVLYERNGRQMVQVMISISSPHRGSPIAKYILDLGPGVTDVINALFTFYGEIVYGPGNDGYAATKQLVYNDYDPADGIATGAKLFNQNNPVSNLYAARYASLMTAQSGLSVNPALYLVRAGFYNIDGDGYCVDDCDNDGAGGKGDGNPNNDDDDGLVGINSQQMGYRLRYTECFLCQDSITTDLNLGYVGNLNAPSALQMTSKADVINQDHLDVIGMGPDTFDEKEFYAAIFAYIAQFGG
ncbi:MAG TPA: acetyltransferase [Blastocatellia bacterium]|nr:acetyltransferase [Blastocatellia bacterium]